jgi:protein CpxP
MNVNRFKLLAVVLSIAMATAAFSQTVVKTHQGMGRRGSFSHMLGFYTDYLDLTDAQQAQMKDIIAKEKPSIQPLMQQLRQGHQQMSQLEQAATFDEAKVREMAAQQTQTLTELTVQRARVESEMYQVLTPDQKTKLSTIITQHEQRFMNHMQGQAQGPGQTQNQ